MANFISEDDIQKSLGTLLTKELKYDEWLHCQHGDSELGRTSEKKVISKERLKKALLKINNHLPTNDKSDAIDAAILELTRNRSKMLPLAANKEVHRLIKDGFKTKIKDSQGNELPEKVIFIDFHKPKKNEFIVAEEVWIQGKKRCRTDMLIYVNGIPLVFIELKNSNIPVKNAYSDNLYRYKRDIAPLFNYNAFIILSNGLETKTGSFTSEWVHFNEWKRIKDEGESFDPEEEGISLERVIKGMCDKERLLDIYENFIFYFSDNAKIIAKNHQYLGVNNGIASFQNRLKKEGKLGIFWHTQGSGKSFSMIFFTMKIFRKYTGDYTFVLVTDRDSLDDQIFKNFLKAEIINEKDEAKAQSRKHLKTMLGKGNKKYIFTLIQKFGTEKGEEFPLLTKRSDIIVLVDEAHRSQYDSFAQNMRKAMPNANYLAFTGTPLLDANQTTRKWFGEYVSEYNFAQSVDDGATVPIFYENRVPTVQLGNDYINQDLAEIVENDNLTPEQEERLKQRFTNELEVVKRDSRLEIIAQDIVKHFPYREYRGKAMVISIDKYTTVKMYDKVKSLWKKEILKLNTEIRNSTNLKEREELTVVRKFMRETEMYVVVSKDGKDEENFEKQGLDIKPHHRANDKKYGNEKLSLKDRFQKDDDNFRLVFVCSKWLTGFDSPTISTLYLDKPMTNHTLMQTIARANRVAADKSCGLVIDYYGVFEDLEKALNKYGKKHNDKLNPGDKPVMKKEALRDLLKKVIEAGRDFLAAHDCDIDLILQNEDTFKQIKHFATFSNKLSVTEEIRKEFNVHENAIRNIYKATTPDKKTEKYKRIVEAYGYLRQIINRENQIGDFQAAVDSTRILMDESIESDKRNNIEVNAPTYAINNTSEIDLRTLNLNKIVKKFKQTELKYLAIVDIKDFLNDQLERMMRENTTRIDFAAKLQEIIDRYNAKSSDINKFFEELMVYLEKLREEELRHVREELTKEELQVFDLLTKNEKLTKEQKQTAKLASKELLDKLKAEREKILLVDWHKNQRQRIEVERYIMKQLYPQLKDIFEQPKFKQKSSSVFDYFFDLAESGQYLGM